jgi:hypothetical protein
LYELPLYELPFAELPFAEFTLNLLYVGPCMAEDVDSVRLPCIFPFEFEGVPYHGCIKDSNSTYWCSLGALGDGTLHFGYCDESCPTDVYHNPVTSA